MTKNRDWNKIVKKIEQLYDITQQKPNYLNLKNWCEGILRIYNELKIEIEG